MSRVKIPISGLISHMALITTCILAVTCLVFSATGAATAAYGAEQEGAAASPTTTPAICTTVAHEWNTNRLMQRIPRMTLTKDIPRLTHYFSARVDLFGNGSTVIATGADDPSPYSLPYTFWQSDGSLIDISVPDDDLMGQFDPLPANLVVLAGRAYILGMMHSAPYYLVAIGKDRVAHIECQFRASTTLSGHATVTPRTPLEALLYDAQTMDSDPSVFALSGPGLRRLKLLMELPHDKMRLSFVDHRSLGSPLVDAVVMQRHDALLYLLKSGVYPDWSDSDHTALSWATQDQLVNYEIDLLNYGADPSEALDRGTDVESLALLGRLFSYGLNPAPWVYQDLYYMTDSKGKSQAELLALRAEAARFQHTHIPLALVEKIMATPGADLVGDTSVLKLALSYSDATDCPAHASAKVLHHCLPRELRESDGTLNQLFYERLQGPSTYTRRLNRDELRWIRKRDVKCGVHPTYHALGPRGWYAYVLGSSARAACVVAMTRKRIAYLKGLNHPH